MPDSANAPENLSSLTEEQAAEIIQSLRRKQGNWVQWGEWCQQLQKASYSPQDIFEQTGFEPIQQNQVIVATQVYNTLLQEGVSEPALTHFSQRGSDLLYELRILNQRQRAAIADLIVAKQLDLDGTREAVKALKDFSRLSAIPDGFTDHPGDAISYQFWKFTRQQTDLQARSRLIAKAFTFVHSPSARQQIEKLLTDFSIVPKQEPPKWPMYRADADESMPRLIPLVGQWPITHADLNAVPLITPTPPFNWVRVTGDSAWAALPGWQVILAAVDPIAVIGHTDNLPFPPSGAPEPVLIVIDRAMRDWDSRNYFICESSDQLELQWFETEPTQSLLGRVILVLRPPKVFDSDYLLESWQLDE
jgi:hypothetical protein